jgi:hypothetical protein
MPNTLNDLPILGALSRQLPPFTPTGGLEPGDFAPDRVEFEDRFVDTGKAQRRTIYNGWNDHRAALLSDGLAPTSRQLVNGSFTTAKAEPGDIDLAVEVPTTRAQLLRGQDEPVVRLLLGPLMKARFLCDAYPIYVLPPTDPNYQHLTVRAVQYWTKWFGQDRQGKSKGRVWSATGGMS